MKQYSRNIIANATRNTVNAQLFDEQEYALFLEQDAYAREVEALCQYTYAELVEMFGYGNDGAIGEAMHIVGEREDEERFEAEADALREFYDAHKDDEDHGWFDYYSDWYKDVHGIRPHWVRFE